MVAQKVQQNEYCQINISKRGRRAEVAAWEPIRKGPEQAWEMDVTEEPLIKTINNWQFSWVANEFYMEQLPPHLKKEVSFQVCTGLDCFCK